MFSAVFWFPFKVLFKVCFTLKLLFFKRDIMVSKCIFQELVSEGLDLDIGDIFRVPEEAVSDIFVIDIQIDLPYNIFTSTRIIVSLNWRFSSSLSLKLSPRVIT